MPTVLVSTYSPVQGRSVPAWRRTAYSSGDSWARHSSSVLLTVGCFDVVMPQRYGGRATRSPGERGRRVPCAGSAAALALRRGAGLRVHADQGRVVVTGPE